MDTGNADGKHPAIHEKAKEGNAVANVFEIKATSSEDWL